MGWPEMKSKYTKPIILFDIHIAVTKNGFVLDTPEGVLVIYNENHAKAAQTLMNDVAEAVGYISSKHDEFICRAIVEKYGKEVE